MRPGSPRVGRCPARDRDDLAAVLIHLGSVVPRDIGDPLAEAWQPAWGGHALLHQPLHFFDANRFWPLKDSLAFGDALIGYAPTGIIGSGPHAAMVRYDLLFLFAYALAFFGAYLLARELGLEPGRRRDRGCGVRLRALPARAGRPPAGDLERRHPAGDRVRGARASG